MKTNKVTIILAAILLVLLTGSAFGQASLQSTTLSAAVTNTATVIPLTSATGVIAPSNGNPGSLLMIDQEILGVQSISGNNVTVFSRGQGIGGFASASSASNATGHANGAKVWVGIGRLFSNYNPIPHTPCTSATLLVLPRVVPATGIAWNCGNSLWTNFVGDQTTGAVLASAATIAPTNPVHHVSGTAAVVNITVPAACPYTGCVITLVPDGIFTWTAAGNIAVLGTAVVNRSITFTWEPVSAKWIPSYV